ncbi:hypothetical protein ABH941_007806 [Streptacidiphilus sp. EB103A]
MAARRVGNGRRGCVGGWDGRVRHRVRQRRRLSPDLGGRVSWRAGWLRLTWTVAPRSPRPGNTGRGGPPGRSGATAARPWATAAHAGRHRRHRPARTAGGLRAATPAGAGGGQGTARPPSAEAGTGSRRKVPPGCSPLIAPAGGVLRAVSGRCAAAPGAGAGPAAQQPDHPAARQPDRSAAQQPLLRCPTAARQPDHRAAQLLRPLPSLRRCCVSGCNGAASVLRQRVQRWVRQ